MDAKGGKQNLRASSGFRLTISKWEVTKDPKGKGKGKEPSGGDDLSFDDVLRPPRLYRVKGVEDPYIRQVPLSSSSINPGDTFILDAEKCLYIWMGKYRFSVTR